MTPVIEVDEALSVAQDVADLIALSQQRVNDSAVEAVVAAVINRHRHTAVKFSTAAHCLGVSATTITSWVDRGVLKEVKGHPVRKVSSVSLGQALALLRQLGKELPNRRERVLRALEALRDRDLLQRAQVAVSDEDAEFLTYDEADLEELRKQ